MEQMSDLFVEHRYFKFQDEIHFSYYNNGTLKHHDSESSCGCFFQVLHHITCMTDLC